MATRNIFVLFAPGTGGNHIANMLSTDRNFPSRTSAERYQAHDENNAHVSDIHNLRVDQMVSIPNCNILCGHWGEYYWLWDQERLDCFPNRQVVIVTLPRPNSMAYQRYQRFGPSSEYLVEEQRSLYTPLVIEKMFGETDWIELDPDWIFCESLDRFFKFAKSDMDLDLDQDQCESMHRTWFDMIKQTLTVR